MVSREWASFPTTSSVTHHRLVVCGTLESHNASMEDASARQATPEWQHLISAVDTAGRKFRRGSAGWAVAYHVSLFGAAVMSAGAALFLEVPTTPKTGIAATLATVAALLTTLSSVGGFQAKWHADRDAFYALDELQLDIEDPEITSIAVRSRLKAIIRQQHGSWVSPGPEPERADDGQKAEA
jgi:hypothetical protein